MIVCREVPKNLPSHIFFTIGEFGWEFSVLRHPEEKASYLYTSALCLSNDWSTIIEQLRANLALYNITCDFQKPEYGNGWLDNGYVDHCGQDEHVEWVQKMLTDPEELVKFLFNDKSYVMLGNDNCSDDENKWKAEQMNPPYKHDTYYKGN
jgi:hypothetical protein